ncbi:hypothetical protein IAE35_02495 [Pseudomonas sp. S75]|uniref:hypothetical protein n=1 Tax=unclassified Pseudomonas TaxID=196821 RepID=UPI00190459C4|nr:MULTISPECIES: hypothetical protein [unclassified Pseudomonas]MBJ9973874.1 hypothetical protein [Pseudomonas sp. S30]MBK0152196.1 hypothetical protein [Pseudomonas sp. S75]
MNERVPFRIIHIDPESAPRRPNDCGLVHTRGISGLYHVARRRTVGVLGYAAALLVMALALGSALVV